MQCSIVPCSTQSSWRWETNACEVGRDDDVSLETAVLGGFAVVGFGQHDRHFVSPQLTGSERRDQVREHEMLDTCPQRQSAEIANVALTVIDRSRKAARPLGRHDGMDDGVYQNVG